jgi:cytoskeletal protein CcmA (bactofilin family)
MLFHKRAAKESDAADRPHEQMPLNCTESEPPPHLSIIDPGLVITGELSGNGELRIEGRVDGSIRGTRVVVARPRRSMAP